MKHSRTVVGRGVLIFFLFFILVKWNIPISSLLLHFDIASGVDIFLCNNADSLGELGRLWQWRPCLSGLTRWCIHGSMFCFFPILVLTLVGHWHTCEGYPNICPGHNVNQRFSQSTKYRQQNLDQIIHIYFCVLS